MRSKFVFFAPNIDEDLQRKLFQDIVKGVTGVVKKPIQSGRRGGAKGFVKGLGKGFLGLVGRPTSGVADLTSTSFKLIKRQVKYL